MNRLIIDFDKIISSPNGITKARELVLQLAFSGKLTEKWQDKNLNKNEIIKQINQISISKSEIKNIEYNDKEIKSRQIIWEKNWALINIEDACNLTYGKNLPKVEFTESGYDVFGANGIIGKYTKFLYKKPQLLISCRGAYSGKSNISPSFCFVTNNSIVCEFYNTDYLNIYFYKYYFDSINKTNIISGSAQPQVTINNLKKIYLPYPSINEQKQIVEKVNSLMSFLDELQEKQFRLNDKKIKLNNSSLDKLIKSENTKEFKLNWNRITQNFQTLYSVPENVDKLKQTILQLAVQGKLTEQWRKENPNVEPASELLRTIKREIEKLKKQKIIKKQLTFSPLSKEDRLFDFPKEWEYTYINEILFVTKLAGFEYTKYISLSESGDIPVIRAQNVRMGRLDTTNLLYIDKSTSELLDRCSLVKPSILMTFIGAGIGDVAIFDKKERWHLAPNVAKIEPFPLSLNYIDLHFLLFFLMSPVGRNEIFSFQKSTAQPSLSMGTIRQIKTVLPPVDEQKQIVKIVNELIDTCNKLEAKIKVKTEEQEKLVKTVVSTAMNYN